MELVTGGSGSGKSAYAEAVICRAYRAVESEERRSEKRPFLYYIADMVPHGAETEKKIAAHREMRAGKGFQTLEWYLDLPGKLSGGEGACLDGAFVLLECVSNLTANEMYEQGGAREDTVESVVSGIRMLKEKSAFLVVVTNDVFGESGDDSEEMAVYKQNLGEINRKLAEMADQVTEVSAGIPAAVKTAADQSFAAWTETESYMEKEKNRMERGIRLVTGGAYQGKRRYAQEVYPGLEWADGAECPLSAAGSCGAMENFHLFVKRWLQAGRTKEELLQELFEKNGNIVIVCDEIGCGLVPVDAFEREYRETAGRVCTELGRHAVRVDRVVCGIGMRIR